jgi:hypothetical protein
MFSILKLYNSPVCDLVLNNPKLDKYFSDKIKSFKI